MKRKNTKKGVVMGLSVSFKIKGGYNSNQLLAAYKNNMRKYKNYDEKENLFPENIKYNVLLYGEENIYQGVRKIYKVEFREAVDEYNKIQKRSDRKIYDYFEKIASDKKTNLFTEIIIQIGDKYYWENKSIEEKQKMIEVFREQIKIINEYFPNFKMVNAICHLDMISPKTHIIGVCVSNKELALKNNPKKIEKTRLNGMDTYVSQVEVFNKLTLLKFHSIFSKKSIEIFNLVYNLNEIGNDKKLHQNHLELEEYKKIAPTLKKMQQEYDNLKLKKEKLEREIKKLKKEKNDLNSYIKKLKQEDNDE